MISSLLTGAQSGEYWGSLVAAEMFAEHFSEDSELRLQIIAEFERRPRGFAAAALAEALLRKPDASIEDLLRTKVQSLRYDIATHFKLMAALSTPQRLTGSLIDLLQKRILDAHELQLARWIAAVVRRIERDPEVQAELKRSLRAESPPSVKVSFVALLQRASGVDDDARIFASEELKRSEAEPIPEVGFDLVSQAHRIVRHVLTEALA